MVLSIVSVLECEGRGKNLSMAGSWFPGLLSWYVRGGPFSLGRSVQKMNGC